MVVDYCALAELGSLETLDDRPALVPLPSGGEEPFPAPLPAVPFPGHGVFLRHVVLL